MALIFSIFLSLICLCGDVSAEENNLLLTGTQYSLLIKANGYTTYIYQPEYEGTYMIMGNSDSCFNYYLFNTDYENDITLFSYNKTLYQNEVYNFTFYNPNSFDITINFSITPNFLPEIDTISEGLSIRKGLTATLFLTTPSIVKTATWSSSDTNIATIDANGTVTAISYGMTTITVNGTTLSDTEFSDSYNIYVSEPMLSTNNLSLNIYGLNNDYGCYYPENNRIDILGINQYSTIEVLYPEDKLQLIDYYDYEYTSFSKYVNPKKKGTSTITFIVDGLELKCDVNVFKAYFVRNKKTVGDIFSKKWIENSSTLALYKGEKTTLKAKGFGNNTIKWTSSNKKIATVNKKGLVTAKGYGTAVITAQVGSTKISYPISVSYKKAILAIRYANKHHGSTYSQAKRMENGYYDCSSYAWRSYNSAKMNVGPLPNWAPTAADMAAWCTDNGYMIASGTVNTSDLLPGDLIFSCGENNGRYNGIYHVDLYHGNYSSITVEDVYYCHYYMQNVMVARPCAKNSVSLKTFSPVLYATKTNKRSISLKWSLMHDSDGYVIYRKNDIDGKYSAIKTIKGEGNITFTNKNLKKGRTYYYKVRAYRKIGGKRVYSKYSEELSFTT